jgi:hypothetical protein
MANEVGILTSGPRYHEAVQDLWLAGESADAIVITTNGTVTGRRLGVMGRGCALEAADRYNAEHASVPGRRLWTLQRRLGRYLEENGNHVGVLVPPPPHTLVVFPVKIEWFEIASLTLIEQSVFELISLTDRMQWRNVVLPRPGCGNGGRTWDDVKPLLGPLDSRFTVVTK